MKNTNAIEQNLRSLPTRDAPEADCDAILCDVDGRSCLKELPKQRAHPHRLMSASGTHAEQDEGRSSRRKRRRNNLLDGCDRPRRSNAVNRIGLSGSSCDRSNIIRPRDTHAAFPAEPR